MPFVKRHLTGNELSQLNFAQLGVIKRRIPLEKWDWAVDSARDVLCTQLRSDNYEMREGNYWYLLVVHGKPFIFWVDAFRSQRVGGELRVEAILDTSGVPASEVAAIQQLASEAHQAVSYRGERLVFLASRFPSAA
jgi:hypothetical protein